MNKGIAVYPGSFDPPTNGHLDLIERGSKIFEELVVAILRNSEKTPLFTHGGAAGHAARIDGRPEERSLDTFDGLMVEFAKSIDAKCVLRGIRAISDYEYELQMALMNRKLRPDAGNGVHDARRQVFVCEFAAGAGSGAGWAARSADWSRKW